MARVSRYDVFFFFFKTIHDLISVDLSIVKFVEPKFQAATYQKSYIIRCVRVWNVFADELILRMNTLNDFKQEMVEYYKTALTNYDWENPCTFKSVCLKCNKCCSLAQPVSCCY